jgi:serine/threonine-protein kinase
MKRADRSPWVPETLGNYQILEQLGQGGMGEIYKAIQQPLNRIVALKILAPQMGRSQESSLRFQSEAKAISLLEHQNIVSIYEYGEEHGLQYFAMLFVEGEDLGKRIADKRPMSLPQIIDISKQICRGLLYAHKHDVIHRDIKPQNVLIDRNNLCRLSDFGIAKIYQQADITLTGMAVGTPEYMSPEQAEGKALDARTDIYSLGVVMYEMLTRIPPFSGNNPVAIAYKQVHELPTPPSAYRRDTPKRLELIILKALKKSRDERYRNVEAMLHDLDTVRIDEKVDRATTVFPGAGKLQKQRDEFVEKRITDRRFGDRRNSAEASGNPLSANFWVRAWLNQHISLLGLAALAALFIWHLLSHH